MDTEQRMVAFYDAELPERMHRELGDARTRAVRAFAGRTQGSVLEVGCGAARDAAILAAAGLHYVGVDVSPVGVALCRRAGLAALVASATALPFCADRFDSAWTMSTLMHLPAEALATALQELRRVVRVGGVVEIGVWGSTDPHVEFDEHGRRFTLRTDDQFRDAVGVIGELTEFATWDWSDSGFHYQWARLVVA